MYTPARRPQFGSFLADAIYAQDVAQLTNLLATGADPNEIDQYGMPALIKAALSGNVEIVQLLLDAGADPNYREESCNRTALSSARGKAVLMAILRHKPQVEVKVHALKQFLWRDSAWAAEHIMRTLPKPSRAVHAEGITLCKEAGWPQIQTFERIVAACPDETIELYGGLALTRYCKSLRPDPEHQPARWLLARGANVNGADFPSPLISAAERHDVAMVDLLLAAGADPNVTLDSGVAPLGVLMGWFEMHADRKVPSRNFDRTADRIAELLLVAGANVNQTWDKTSVLMVATAWRPYNIRRLLEAGADATYVNAEGWGPLHLCEQVSAAQRLKQYGADIHTPNQAGETPLHLAAKWGRVAMVKWLWSFPSTRTARTKTGRTALDEARAMYDIAKDEARAEALEFLTQAGAE